ncbi:MAG TPA: FtsX-like permease family protein [Steroidobacteraceae bacterium]|nr:FtsX-like permease family protein [Steroidobacteraceae bacterium]
MLRFLPLLLANLRRRAPRTIFTVLSIAVAFLLYGLLAAVKNGFEATGNLAGIDRLVTFAKVSIVQPLPFSYLQRIAAVPGVKLVTHSTWFGGHYQNERGIIITYPVPPASYLAMYPEFLLPEAQKQRWLHDRVGAVVGRGLAEQFGWKVGDRIPLRSDIYARADGNYTWEFVIDGIYDNKDPSGDVSSVFFNYDYLDESRTIGKGTVGWYIIRVADPSRAVQVAAAIDALFTNSSAETKTDSEKAFVQGFAKQTGDIGAIVTAIGVAVFFTMLLVSANTMAQSVRERTNEVAVLKTLGYTDTAVLALVIGESLLLTVLGGVIGIAGAQLMVGRLGHVLSEYLSAFLLTPQALVLGVVLMVALGVIAGALPAVRAARLRIVDGLAGR